MAETITRSGGITGIVLAGGKSSRMGADKGLLLFRGKPLVTWTTELLGGFCHRILISSNNKDYEVFGYQVVEDVYKDSGPMSGIASCLAVSESEVNLVLTCDMPFVDATVIEALIQQSGSGMFVVPLDERGFAEPLCGIYLKSTLPLIESSIRTGAFKMTSLFSKGGVKYLRTDEYSKPFDSRWFTNINTPGEFSFSENL